MWLYFDRNGALKQKLEHGSPARSGTTDFAIFAYFEDLPSNEDYRIATMKLYRPDLENTAYPMLMMTECPMRYEYMESDGSQTYFEDGKDYVGYLFDFSHFGVSDYAPTVLLDMPGRWKAVISLIGPNGAPSVTGMCIFDVQEGITYQDGTDITQDEMMDNVIQQLSTRARYGNVIFSVNSVFDGQDFSEEFDGYVQSMNFIVGQLFIDKSQSKFYRLASLEMDSGTGVKTYTVEEWIPDVSNGYVTLGTDQTIPANKTFAGDVTKSAFQGDVKFATDNVTRKPTLEFTSNYPTSAANVAIMTVNPYPADSVRHVQQLQNKDGIIALKSDVDAAIEACYTKTQADAKFVSKAEGARLLYGTDSSGNQTTLSWSQFGNSSAKNTVAVRDAQGALFGQTEETSTMQSYVNIAYLNGLRMTEAEALAILEE